MSVRPSRGGPVRPLRVLHMSPPPFEEEPTEQVEEEVPVAACYSSRVVLLPSNYRPTSAPPATRSELPGLSLLEAMACGTESIHTDVGGMPEFEHDRDGFVIDPDDPSPLAPAVCAPLSDDAPWERMSVIAPASATKEFCTSIALTCVGIYQHPTPDSIHEVESVA
jgi:glycosyltransferase involved in cell wall biosynthesis